MASAVGSVDLGHATMGSVCVVAVAASAHVVDEVGMTLENLKAMAARVTCVAVDSVEINPATQGRTDPKLIFQV
jgi:hypothetical protein